MNPGDLVKIRFVNNDDISGHGIYLGKGKRNSRDGVHEFFWKVLIMFLTNLQVIK